MFRTPIAPVALLLVGCTQNLIGTDDDLIVPGERIGPYVIHQSTRAEIQGEDRAAVNRRIADQGIYFEYEQGQELTGITVTSDRFRTPEGIRVGSSVDEVCTAYGKPRLDVARSEEKKLSIPGLYYDGVAFVTGDGKVTAIRVGAN